MKKLVVSLLCVMMITSFMPSMAFATDESITESEIIEIDSADDLAKIGTENEYPADGNYVLVNDIELSEKWTPICGGVRSGSGYSDDSIPFTGTFDGGNHTIKNLTITQSDNADAAVGLVGIVDGGTVKNLRLEDVNIDVKTSELAGGAIGMLTGGGTAENIEVVSGTVCAARGNGGIVGRMTLWGTIKGCTNNATISGVGTGGNVGGIVGAAYYTSTEGEMSIIGCENNGSVSGKEEGVIGGIVGLSAANVSECVNTAEITGNGADVAGIAAEQQNYGRVEGCINRGNIINKAEAYGTGGIVGWVRYNGAVESYPKKDIVEVLGNKNYGSISGGNDAGGIIGTVYNAAVVKGNENYAKSLAGTTFAAGIIGNLQFTETPVGNIPTQKVTMISNISTTSIEKIEAQCKSEYIYNNEQQSPDGITIEDNGTEFVAQIGDDSYTTLQYAVSKASDGQEVTLLKNINLSEPITIDKNVKINGAGHYIGKAEDTELSSALITIESGKTLTLQDVNVSGIDNTGKGIVSFNPTSNMVVEGTVNFENNTATTVLVTGTAAENTVTVKGTLNISNNVANGMNGGKLIVSDGGTVTANGNTFNGISAVVTAGENTSLTTAGNGKRGLTLYGGSEFTDNAVVTATGNAKNDIEINNGDNNAVTIAGNATVTAGTMAGHDGSEAAKGRDKVVVVNGSAAKVVVTNPVTNPEAGAENTTAALFKKTDENSDTRANGVVILGSEGTVHGTVTGKIDLPAGVTVTVTTDANASGAIFDAPAGTVVKNESNQQVKVETPSGEITLDKGESVTSKPSSGGGGGIVIPPVAQKPTIEAEEGATVTLSKDGTTATIVVDKDATLKDVLLNGKSLGAVTEVKNLKTEDKLVVVVETLAEKNARLKAGVENTTIKLKSALGKGHVRLDWNKSEGYKVDNYQVFRSTKRYSGYGTKAYFETTKGGLKGWYKNTKQLKKGTRYYYKVRGVREIAGEAVYTQWSNKAWRLVK